MTKFFLLLFAGLSLCFSSCDESSVVGLDVQPSNDLLNVSFQDTTTLVTKTILQDSLRTDEDVISTALIGKYIDPVFGESASSLYTQVALSTNITSFGATPICDSIVISLAYDPSYYYGRKERKKQTLNVYEVTEAIPVGAKYSNKTLTKGTDRSGAYDFVPRPSDSVYVSGVKSKPQLRIRLNKDFGQGFLDNPSNLANNTTFQTVMKGFYITTEGTTTLTSGEGNILKFKLPESKMTLYYNYLTKTIITPNKPVQADSVVYVKYDFSLGSDYFLHFTHTYTTADPSLTVQLSATPPAQNDVVFLQSMSGLKTKIEMPALMHWNDSGAVAINKAELVLKVDLSSSYQLDTFAAPAKLVLFGIGDNGNEFFLPDMTNGLVSSYFGGYYNVTLHEYHFNIVRYVQQVLDRKIKNNGLHLLTSNDAVNIFHLLTSSGAVDANRVVIGGGKNTSSYQMKLNITYTKLH